MRERLCPDAKLDGPRTVGGAVLEMIRVAELRKQFKVTEGKTVLFSTHIVDQMAIVSDRQAVIYHPLPPRG